MAVTSYLRRAGRAPASESTFETLALGPPAAKTPPPPRSSTPKIGERTAPATAPLFDALGLEAGGAAALRAPRRGQPPSAQQVAARLAERAEQARRAAAAARAARAARAAAEEGPEAAAPASQVLFDALALDAGCQAPRRRGARQFVAPTRALLLEMAAKGAKPQPSRGLPAAAGHAAFSRHWSVGSTADSGSDPLVDSENVSPLQTEDQLPPVALCLRL